MMYRKHMIALAVAGLALNAYAGGGSDYGGRDERALNLSRSNSFSESSADAWAKADAESNARANIDGSGNSKSYSGVDNSGNNKSYSGVDGSGNSKSYSGLENSGNSTSYSGLDRSGNSRSNSNSNVDGSGNSKVNASGGNQRQSQGQNVRTGGNKTNVTVSGAGGSSGGGRDSFYSKTTVWAPVVHGPPAAPLASASIVMKPHPCGPRVDVMSEPVLGKRFGVLGGTRDVEQGVTESVVPADEPFLRRGNMVFGHEVVEYVTVVGTSSAGSFSIAGYGTNGNGAQGGASGGGALQQMVVKVSVRECVMSVEAPSPAPVGVLPEAPEQTLQWPAPVEPVQGRPLGQERG